MTNYVLWTTGLRGPVASVLRNRRDARLVDRERAAQIGAPILVAPEHEGLGLTELARLYPCPAVVAPLPSSPPGGTIAGGDSS